MLQRDNATEALELNITLLISKFKCQKAFIFIPIGLFLLYKFLVGRGIGPLVSCFFVQELGHE